MTHASMLSRALYDEGEPAVRLLPPEVADLLLELAAPPRLAAHLRAVHDVAHRLVELMETRYSGLAFDRDAVLFGAATHDIGKVIHVGELSGPGSAHEEAGRELLLARGVDGDRARFAGTHGSWTGPGIGTEDLLVSLADKVWKNKRVADLEDLVVGQLAAASGRQRWEEFMELDDVLGRIGAGADHRLAFQASYPVRC